MTGNMKRLSRTFQTDDGRTFTATGRGHAWARSPESMPGTSYGRTSGSSATSTAPATKAWRHVSH